MEYYIDPPATSNVLEYQLHIYSTMLPQTLAVAVLVASKAVASLYLVQDGDTFVDLAARSDQSPVIYGLHAGMLNAQQRLDSTVRDIRNAGNRPAASVLTNLITGLDGQIDTVLGMISGTLGQLTGGLAEIPFQFILGPTFQSITDGAEVLIGNTLGGAIDLAVVPAIHVLSGSLSNLANTAVRLNMQPQATRFATLAKQANMAAVRGETQHRGNRQQQQQHHRHLQARGLDNSIGINSAAQSVASIQNSIERIVKDFDDAAEGDSRPPTQAVSRFVSDLDTQISKGIETLSSSVSNIGPIPEAASFALTTPLFRSAAGATERLTMSLAGGTLDESLSGALDSLSEKIQVLAETADEYSNKQFTHSLNLLNRRVQNLASTARSENQLAARSNEGGIMGIFSHGVTNAQQRIDSFVNELNSPNARPGSQLFVNLLTGIDGQIDNLLGAISGALSSVTFGISDIPFNFILGPTFQSITDGAEVLIGNLAGSVIDDDVLPIIRSLSGNIMNLANVANEHGMNSQALALAQQSKRLQLAAIPAGNKRPGSKQR
ncbi:hypothetical protein TRICI_004498 [Trichomonascus ciferrii]|uniref:Uncharacterized protein n=1 Tax=Trichomonascus ciferrii TaxID=44093 RepID=A0A642V0P7_9ASCO|nr:hypothetical protein TRICI_004498 [Trichomonascus ciferrii]